MLFFRLVNGETLVSSKGNQLLSHMVAMLISNKGDRKDLGGSHVGGF